MIGSVCTGLGALDVGVMRALSAMGVPREVAWSVESDAYCRQHLCAVWPDAVSYRDLRTFPVAEAKPVDVLVGGTPCQGFSTAGRARLLADERSRPVGRVLRGRGLRN